MATLAKPLPVNHYERFRFRLFDESPRAAYWLESMVFGIMAQLDGMTEEAALELACKIIAYIPQADRPSLTTGKKNGSLRTVNYGNV